MPTANADKPPAICPWLGTEEDRRLRFREPMETHRCYAQPQPAVIDATYQAQVCLGAEHTTCRFFVKMPPPERARPRRAPDDEMGPPVGDAGWLRIVLWGLVVVLAVAAAIVFGRQLFLSPLPVASPTSSLPAATATFSPTPRPTGTAASATLPIGLPTDTPTPYPGGQIYVLSPEAGAAGWVASDEGRGNHLGDSYLYTGVFDGVIYHGIFQVDLAPVPRGATIYAATLEITGLNGQRLGQGGVWQVRTLARGEDAEWSRKTFQDVHNAEVLWTLLPAMVEGDLEPGRVNSFALSQAEIAELQQRLLDEHYTLSIRIDGPIAGASNVFAWDTGYAAATQGKGPRLVLNVGPAPKTALPTGTPAYVVVTSTPTPANVLTAEARGLTATAAATRRGQPTPTSIYEWTATPPLVVTSTPTPADGATATMQARLATAIAFTTGTFTPTPDYMVTATPTRVVIPFEQITLTPAPPATPRPDFPEALRGLVLFQSNRAGGLNPWAMDAQGGGVGLLTAPWPYSDAAAGVPLSPDGTRVLYVGTENGQPAILERPAGGGTGQPVTVRAGATLSAPAWSPTGNWIAFVAGANGSSAIWVVRIDGTDLRQLTTREEGSASSPSFSPDGTRVAYALAGAGGRRQIWSAALDGTGKANLSNNGYDEWGPVWAR